MGFAFVLAATGARADEVYLRDGTRLVGEVVADAGPIVRLAVVRGADRVLLDLPRADVAWVRRLGARHERALAEAEDALARGALGRALDLLGAVARELPDDGAAQRELGFALLLADRPEEALAPLEAAARLLPVDVEARLQRAQALERLGRRDEAVEAWREALRLGPRHVSGWRRLAALLVTRGGPRDREEARRCLELAAREAPDDPALCRERAALELPGLGGDGALAPGALDREAAARAAAVLGEHLARRPGALGVARLAARLAWARGDAGAAIGALDAALGAPQAVDAGEPAAAALQGPIGGLDERAAAEVERAYYAWAAARPGPGGARPEAPPGLDPAAPDADPPRLRAALGLLARAHPDDGSLGLLAARAALRAGELDGASALLEAVALAADGGADQGLLEDALLLLEAAPALRRPAVGPAGDDVLGPGAAATKAARFALLCPWSDRAHAAHARALERAGALDEAVAAWTRAAACAPEDWARARRLAEAARVRDEAARRERNAAR